MNSEKSDAAFAERLLNLADHARQWADHAVTEEATKTALVLPFIGQVLGFDIRNPTQVVPEYVADLPGIRKGEKVDYAILDDGEPIMLFECKRVGTALAEKPASQLFRYFTVTNASVGVLTDGVRYRFFSDISEANKLDRDPFLELDLSNPESMDACALNRFAFPQSGPEAMRQSARELKFTRIIRNSITSEIRRPSNGFVRLFADRVASGAKTRALIDEIRPLVRTALRQIFDERAREIPDYEPESDSPNDESPAQDQESPPQLSPKLGKIAAITLFGTRKSVPVWNRMLAMVAEECWRRAAVSFADKVVGWGGPKWDIVGNDPQRIQRPRPIGNSGYHITANVSANSAMKYAFEILHRCGFSDSELVVHAPLLDEAVDHAQMDQVPVNESDSDSQADKPTSRAGPTPITGFLLWGNHTPVKYWYEVLVAVAAACCQRNPNAFAASVVGWRGRNREIVGNDPRQITNPAQIPGTAHFISRHGSANTITRRAEVILKRCGFSPKDLKVLRD